MRFTILSALLLVASIVCATAQSSGTVGYNRTTLSVAPTNLIFRAASITSKITNASIYGITGLLKGDGIGGSVLATPGVDYEPAGGGETTVSVNGSEVSTPNFTNSATATFSVSTTNVSVNPTNLANAQIAAGAAIGFSKLSGVAASVHVHAGEDITSGTVAAPRIDSAIATDAEVAAGFQPLDSDLTALAGNGSNGLLARTGSGTVAARTLTGDSEITVSNGDGVSGNPTLAIASSIARDSEVSSAVANVIHSNVAGEITAITDKATPVAADHILIEDSAASDAKKDITIASLETAFEGFLDLQDLQGAVTDAQVPNTITVDLATLATTATIANSGDSATAFFSSGEIEDARLPSTLTRDSEWDTIGEIETATSANIIVSTEVDSIGELETLLGGVNVILATEIDTQAELEALSGVSFATDSEVAAGYQPLDSDLTAVAGLSASGLIARTGSGTVATRTITGDSEITVSDGDGVSGNPTLAIAAAIARDAEVAAAYQPLDADLTSLSGGITGLVKGAGNGSGFSAATANTDYEPALTDSASLRTTISDESGAGAAIFADSPTFTDDVGIGTASVAGTAITAKGTTADSTAYLFRGLDSANNVSAMLDNSGRLDLVRLGTGGAVMVLGNFSASPFTGQRIGHYAFKGLDDGLGSSTFAYIDALATTITKNSLYSEINLRWMENVDAWPGGVYSYQQPNKVMRISGDGLEFPNDIILGSSAAAVGKLRIPNNTQIAGRNAVNNADIVVAKVNSDDSVTLGTGSASVAIQSASTTRLTASSSGISIPGTLTLGDGSGATATIATSLSGASDPTIVIGNALITTSHGITASLGNFTAPNGGYVAGSSSGYFVSTRGSVRASADGAFEVFNNAGSSSAATSFKFGLKANPAVAGTIASAGTIAPTAPVTFVSGVAAIATITAPSPISSTGGQITLIPTGIWTTTTAGNIALATTAVVSKALIMTYDATTTKWYPSY